MNGISDAVGGGDVSLDIHGGSTNKVAHGGVTVNGTVKVGIQNIQTLTITPVNPDQITQPSLSDLTITKSVGVGAITLTLEDVSQVIVAQINHLNDLKASHASDPDAIAGYNAHITTMQHELLDTGLIDKANDPAWDSTTNDFKPNITPTPRSLQVTVINLPNILARLGNINVTGDYLAGGGDLESPGNA